MYKLNIDIFRVLGANSNMKSRENLKNVKTLHLDSKLTDSRHF